MFKGKHKYRDVVEGIVYSKSQKARMERVVECIQEESEKAK